MRTNKLYAVIHTIHPDQALVNAAIARDGGADGAFLIDHTGREPFYVINCYKKIREEFPDWFLGLNFLRHPASSLTFLPRDTPQAIWFDDVGYDESRPRVWGKLPKWIRFTLEMKHGFDHPLVFGGVDFKHQTPVKDLALAVRRLSSIVDVITTSGPKTGSPPTVEKLSLMRKAAPEAKIAVASGMTQDNVLPFLDYVDYFLVATGISKDFHYLDPLKVRAMARRMRR